MSTEKVPCKQCGGLMLPSTGEKTGGLCRLCEKKRVWSQQQSAAMATDPPEWELSSKNAHPNAQRILTDAFFWDEADDGAPLGNDTGSDVLHMYREWRISNPKRSPVSFLSSVLKEWEVPEIDWDVIEPGAVQEKLQQNDFWLLTRDDTVIALAFAQFILDGTVDSSIQQKATVAISRQSLDTVITFRGWVDVDEHRAWLSKMQKALNAIK